MDWSIVIYFLAAVVAAGVSYAVWPKGRRPELNISNEPISGETSHEDAAVRSVA